MISAVILGATGYGGGELIRLLTLHPEVEFVDGWSVSRAGWPMSSVHPNLRKVVMGDFSEDRDWTEFAEVERLVVFAALPHGEFSKRLPMLEDAWSAAGLTDRVTVLDLSGDFRLNDEVSFGKAYGMEHPCPERLTDFVYGCPEWNRAEIIACSRIACPGSFATGLLLGIAPLGELGVERVTATGIVGSSSSGAIASEATHHPARANDFRAYKALVHQHPYEVQLMLRELGINMDFSFVPHSAPIVRGTYVTIQFDMPEVADLGDLVEAFESAYAGSPFVRIVDGPPRVESIVGSNFADIGLEAFGPQGVVMVALDNLLKGMAGQAVQCMNIALGLDETTGLWFPGVYPI